MPIVAGSEINDDPYKPVSHHARVLVAERGDETPIEWVHRERRYGEKLATPDTSIADLIGEVDPIKVAEGRYLSDELTIHYGLVPRTNRGIFAINELPDLAERIQVGLLNVLEERDVQIRGYKIRLPLDLMLVASANPEDYTNRGRIITPLKDRFGAQIRTHYPLDVERRDGRHRAGARPLVDRRPPGHGARLHDRDRRRDEPAGAPLAAHQPAVGRVGAACRSRTTRRSWPTPRARARCATARTRSCRAVSDLDALVRVTAGKVEFETVDDGREEQVLERIVKAAVLETFRAHAASPRSSSTLVTPSTRASVVHTGADVPAAEYASLLAISRACSDTLADLEVGETPAGVASAVEFVLEGLHLSKRLNKDAVGGKAAYRGRG